MIYHFSNDIKKIEMKETQWIMMISDLHPNKSDTNAPGMHAEPCLVGSVYIWLHICQIIRRHTLIWLSMHVTIGHDW